MRNSSSTNSSSTWRAEGEIQAATTRLMASIGRLIDAIVLLS
jgi:hypothetical protein